MDMRHRTLGRVLTGELDDALRLAHTFTREAEDDVMSWLVLAEVHWVHEDLEAALFALQKAQAVDGSHPMYYRMVCLAARSAGQPKVTWCAYVRGCESGLPLSIAEHLAKLLDEDMGGDGTEAVDPRWWGWVAWTKTHTNVAGKERSAMGKEQGAAVKRTSI